MHLSERGNSWEGLGFFESADFLAEAHRKRHNEDLTAAKSNEIMSHLSQGREYFESAGEAGYLVRPLLLYYGTLSLARALILYLDPDKTEANLRRKHGLEISGWETTFAKGLDQVPSLAIKTQEGTFSELTEATSNRERFRIHHTPYPNGNVDCTASGSDQIPAGTTVTFGEVLGHLPDLYTHYQRTFKRDPDCYKAFVLMDPNGTYIDILSHDKNPPDAKKVREAFNLDPLLKITESKEHHKLGPIPNISYQIAHKLSQEFLGRAPPIANDMDGEIFLVPPLGGKLRLSSLSFYYIVAYALGMMVRYFPSQWRNLAVVRLDRVVPIMRAAIDFVEVNVPRLVLWELEGRVGWQVDQGNNALSSPVAVA